MSGRRPAGHQRTSSSSLRRLVSRVGYSRSKDGPTTEQGLHGAPVLSMATRTSDEASDFNTAYRQADDGLNCKVELESGQTNLVGLPSESAGAMLSGRVKLMIDAARSPLQLQQLRMILRLSTSFRKSGVKNCEPCNETHQDLKEWILQPDAIELRNGDHEFPWSFLLPGDLPATVDNVYASVRYDFIVIADTPAERPIKFSQPLIVNRMVLLDRPTILNAEFPDTGLSAVLKVPHSISLSEDFFVSLRVKGIMLPNDRSAGLWRLQELSWRIDEQIIAKVPKCRRHGRSSREDDFTEYTKSKKLCSSTVSQEWYIGEVANGGELKLGFEMSANDPKQVLNDVHSPTGFTTKHKLKIELLFAKFGFGHVTCGFRSAEPGPSKLIKLYFDLPVYQRTGSEVGWDQEIPPAYLFNAAAPPNYDPHAEDAEPASN